MKIIRLLQHPACQSHSKTRCKNPNSAKETGENAVPYKCAYKTTYRCGDSALVIMDFPGMRVKVKIRHSSCLSLQPGSTRLVISTCEMCNGLNV